MNWMLRSHCSTLNIVLCHWLRNYFRMNKILRIRCSTFKSNISNLKYLYFPYRSGIGPSLLNPFAAITEGWIIFWREYNFLSDSDEANRGYDSLESMDHCW